MFENMKLSTKLMLSFLSVTFIGLIVCIIGVFNMSKLDGHIDTIYGKDLHGISYTKEAKINRVQAARDWRSALLATTDAEKRKYAGDVKKDIEAFKENIHKAGDLFYTEKGKAGVQEVYKATPEWERLTLEMVNMIVDQGIIQCTPEFDAILKAQNPIGNSIDEKLNELSLIKEGASKKSAQNASDDYKYSLILMLVLISLAFAVSVTIAILFSRYLARQLGGELVDAIAQVHQVSSGNFANEIKLQPRDNSSLLYALRNLQETINGFVNEQRQMADKHAAGIISYHMNTDKFKGTYSQIAHEINHLVQSHIDVKMQVVDVVSQYARGNFKPDMERLPGEKAKISGAVDAVKKSLLDINNEISAIAAASSQGDFSKRSNAENFEFTFKEMLTHLNELVETCETGFSDVLRIANALAQGDLTQTITKDYPGTFGKAKDAMNGTVDNLKALVGEIKESSDTIGTAAKEIAAGNNDLSHRTEEQAASLEETAASMQQLTSTVQTNSENAKYANDLASASSDIARKGVAVVDRVVATMEDINESSRKVVDIITVIDGIAFQTNILALNAAVEAARAGDQGRGFAVVATEVRSLAQRAAAAAGEIKGLISDSVEKVENGTQLVARAGKTMEDIVNSIENVSKTINAITSASVEQNSGIQQVNQAISSMDDVTQQNAALVEEAAAAAEALEDQARNLSTTVRNFKIDGMKMSAPAVKSYAKPTPKSVAPKPVAEIPKPIAAPPKKMESAAVSAPVAKPAPAQLSVAINIDLDGALKKHQDWKVKLRTAISKRETLDAVTISKDNCCDFGKWLYDENCRKKVGHLQSYQDCLTNHTAFHLAAGKVAEVINAKKYDEASEMLGNQGDFAKASNQVGSSIMRLKKETKPQQSVSIADFSSMPEPIKKPAAPKPAANLSDEWEEF